MEQGVLRRFTAFRRFPWTSQVSRIFVLPFLPPATQYPVHKFLHQVFMEKERRKKHHRNDTENKPFNLLTYSTQILARCPKVHRACLQPGYPTHSARVPSPLF